jgi:hypothetical protein
MPKTVVLVSRNCVFTIISRFAIGNLMQIGTCVAIFVVYIISLIASE